MKYYINMGKIEKRGIRDRRIKVTGRGIKRMGQFLRNCLTTESQLSLRSVQNGHLPRTARERMYH